MDSDIKALNPDEKLALVALVRLVIMADGRVSSGEVEEVEDLVEMLGDDAYQKLIDNVENRFHEEKDVRAFLGAITNQDARDTIYGTIMELALNDAVDGKESELLSWLAKAWNIEVTFDEPADE